MTTKKNLRDIDLDIPPSKVTRKDLEEIDVLVRELKRKTLQKKKSASHTSKKEYKISEPEVVDSMVSEGVEVYGRKKKKKKDLLDDLEMYVVPSPMSKEDELAISRYIQSRKRKSKRISRPYKTTEGADAELIDSHGLTEKERNIISERVEEYLRLTKKKEAKSTREKPAKKKKSK